MKSSNFTIKGEYSLSRVDNTVYLMGRVVKGPTVKYTDEGKTRVFYQLQIEPRAKDKGNIQAPFVRSVGNQADKDKDNIKTGDLIVVTGRLITRLEKKKLLFIKDESNPQKLIQLDPENEESTIIYDDDQIFEAEVTRPVTEVMADDVFYFQKFVNLLDETEKIKLFSPKVLKNVLENSDYQELLKALKRD